VLFWGIAPLDLIERRAGPLPVYSSSSLKALQLEMESGLRLSVANSA